MMRWTKMAAGTLAIMTGLVLASGPAAACYTCAPQYGCYDTPGGYRTCYAWVFFTVPYCVTSGTCVTFPFGAGNPPDFFPKLERPTIRSRASSETSAEIDAEVGLYTTIVACPGGCGVFEPGQTSRLLVQAATAGDADQMVGAIARAAGRLSGEMSVAGTGFSVGSGRIEGAFAGRDDNGYAIRAARSAMGVDVSVCAVEARTVSRRLAAESLRPGDLLLVRTWLEDREWILAFGTGPAGSGDGGGEGLRQRRSDFLGRGRTLGARHRGPEFRLELIDVGGAWCQ